MEPGLLVNVLSGAVFLAVLWGCVFLLLPVASIAGNAKGQGWSLAFLGLLAFMAYWAFNGFPFMQDVLTGAVFHAGYWSASRDAGVAAGGFGRGLWTFISWILYIVVTALLAFVTFLAFSEVSGSSSRKKAIAFGVFALLAFLGYLWVRGGRAWLMSIFS